MLRLVSDKLGRLWNQRVVVDNKPGGGGFIAIEQARRAAPDGYTLLQLDSEHIAALPHLYKSRNFVTAAALRPGGVAVPHALLRRRADRFEVEDHDRPHRRGQGEAGRRSATARGASAAPAIWAAQQLEALTGTHMQHVPYREVSQLFANVGSGEVPWSFASIPSSQGIYKAGKLRYIAVAAPKRIPQMPDVPTMAEAGGPAGLEVNSFVSLLTPKGVPRGDQGADQCRRRQGHRRPRDPRALRHLRLRAAGLVAGGDRAQRRSEVEDLWRTGPARQHQPRLMLTSCYGGAYPSFPRSIPPLHSLCMHPREPS